jgi:predicted DsbA family dithiol-disulfide isomerase
MAVKVELFTSDFCPRCAHAKTALKQAIAELGPERFELSMLDVVPEIDRAVALGILATPALAIDGKLVCSGSPTARKLKVILQSRLAESTAGKSHAAVSNR